MEEKERVGEDKNRKKERERRTRKKKIKRKGGRKPVKARKIKEQSRHGMEEKTEEKE